MTHASPAPQTPGKKALSQARRRTSLALSGLELPACFQLATVAAAANAYERDSRTAKASRRRLNDKVRRIQEVA